MRLTLAPSSLKKRQDFTRSRAPAGLGAIWADSALHLLATALTYGVQAAFYMRHPQAYASSVFDHSKTKTKGDHLKENTQCFDTADVAEPRRSSADFGRIPLGAFHLLKSSHPRGWQFSAAGGHCKSAVDSLVQKVYLLMVNRARRVRAKGDPDARPCGRENNDSCEQRPTRSGLRIHL